MKYVLLVLEEGLDFLFFRLKILLLFFHPFDVLLNPVGFYFHLVVLFPHFDQDVVDLSLLVVEICSLAEVGLLAVLYDLGRVVLSE